MTHKTSTLASTNRRDKLRTQGDIMEDTSDNLLQMGLIKNSMNDRSIEPSQMLIDMPKLSMLAPNLSDAEAMMKFHMNNQSKSDSPLDEAYANEINRMYNPGNSNQQLDGG